jgi:hypothetical protein
MAKDPSAFQRPPMYCLFQARVPTCEGEKIGRVIFDHRPNHEARDKKEIKKDKKEIKNCIKRKKDPIKDN